MDYNKSDCKNIKLEFESSEDREDSNDETVEELKYDIQPWDLQFKSRKNDDNKDVNNSNTSRIKTENETINDNRDREYYCCVFCSRVFQEYGKYEAHLMTHSKLRPYECKICSKQFTHQNNLKQHVRNHDKHRPHICSECGKGFTQKGNLRIHYRVHTGEKPYTCNSCQRCFRQKSILNQHVRTHTGEPQYKCLTCTKEFLQLTNYQHHRCVLNESSS